jgi:hypothetical protein
MRRIWGPGLAAAALVLAVGLGMGSGSSSIVPRRIAYVTGGPDAVPLVRVSSLEGGAARALGPGTDPLMSPSGAFIAASLLSGRHALILYPAGGGFFDRAAVRAIPAAWSADSRYLAVILSSTDPLSDAASGLALIDTRTLRYRILARGTIYGASFGPADRLVYASASSAALRASVDIHVIGADGSGAAQLTRDGRSLNPVWGNGVIAFDRERLGPSAAPAYQLWLMAPTGGQLRQLTDAPVPPLQDGLVPIAISPDGGSLLAEYEGEDTSQAWLVNVAARRARELRIRARTVTGWALSRDGRTALVDLGGFLDAPDAGAVEELPLGGGKPRVLVAHGSDPSWNG